MRAKTAVSRMSRARNVKGEHGDGQRNVSWPCKANYDTLPDRIAKRIVSGFIGSIYGLGCNVESFGAVVKHGNRRYRVNWRVDMQVEVIEEDSKNGQSD